MTDDEVHLSSMWQIGCELAVNVLFGVGTVGVLLYQFSLSMTRL